jgi:chromosome segregation ATPase
MPFQKFVADQHLSGLAERIHTDTAASLLADGPTDLVSVTFPAEILPLEKQKQLLEVFAEERDKYRALWRGREGGGIQETVNLQLEIIRLEKMTNATIEAMNQAYFEAQDKRHKFSEDLRISRSSIQSELTRFVEERNRLRRGLTTLAVEIDSKEREKERLVLENRALQKCLNEMERDEPTPNALLASMKEMPVLQIQPPADDMRGVETSIAELERTSLKFEDGHIPDSLRKYAKPWMALPQKSQDLLRAAEERKWLIKMTTEKRTHGKEKEKGPLLDGFKVEQVKVRMHDNVKRLRSSMAMARRLSDKGV